MINLDGFLSQWNYKYKTFDAGYPRQCTAIVKQWAKENGWPVPNGGGRNAIGYINFRNGYTYEKNTSNGVPKPGDIAVFNIGRNGHVAIVYTANKLHLTCFEQNNPVGSPCRLVTHYFYRKIIGWLHKT